MVRLFLLIPALWIATTFAAVANSNLSVLMDLLKIDEAAQILREEGLTSAEDLQQEMLGGTGGAAWQVQVDKIYDANRMAETVRAAMGAGLSAAEVHASVQFYGSELGQKIVSLENAARRAIQDPDVEAAAREAFYEYKARDLERFDYLTHFIETGDMINRNVTGAMNANFRFFQGLADGQAIEMSEEDMLRDAAGDMDELERDTIEWLFGLLILAYDPLTDEEFDIYIAYAESEAGLALNAALFDGFGAAYEDISYALGRTVALNMQTQEL